MQGWATLFFEAKRIFPHYPWKTNMSLMEGEIQAVPAFMVVSEYIGGSQQVQSPQPYICRKGKTETKGIGRKEITLKCLANQTEDRHS